ncbi:MAG TPA: globin domain-containing protein [Phenylobacterium sp.]|jgi:nitric oxide dioxygenase
MTEDLSAAAIATVKATVPALRIHGVAISERLYERLFADPEIRDLFDPAGQGPNGRMPRALAAAVVAYAENVDNLPALSGAVDVISARHVIAGVRPWHYDAVGRSLLGALQDVLGEAATPAIQDAWAQAYGRLARVLQAREAELRAMAEAA